MRSSRTALHQNLDRRAFDIKRKIYWHASCKLALLDDDLDEMAILSFDQWGMGCRETRTYGYKDPFK